ncbi:unnamed protein product, partial [marine sediment metagenome]
DKRSKINIEIEDREFEIIDLEITKKFSEKDIKSFEKTEIENIINIRNAGSALIKKLSIKETLPMDFIPYLDISNYKLRFSSGISKKIGLKLDISPSDGDSTNPHNLKLRIILNDNNLESLIGENEFLEIRYPFRAIVPDYKKTYEFPLEVKSYYPINQNGLKSDSKDFYIINRELNKAELPNLKIIHKRRNLLIGKEIFP